MLSKDFFKHNREKLFELMEENSMVILFAGQAPRKSGDENYPFCPNRNFYYLTGDDEEKDILVMIKSKNIINEKAEMMFIRRIDPVQARWVGATYTEDYIASIGDFKNIQFLEDFKGTLHMYLERCNIDKVYMDFERESFDEAPTQSMEFAEFFRNKYPGVTLKNCYSMIGSLRMVKDECEIEEIKKAIHITRLGLESIMSNIRKAKNESNLANLFAYTIFENGAKDFAFDTIAAAYHNSTTLHYHANNTDIVRDGVVLFDLGAQYGYYKSDISRTYPANGKFSKEQLTIYNLVLKVQKMVIDAAKPGLTIRDLNNIVIDFYAKELKKLGYIHEDSEVRRYYFHSVSHHLGLDTHDCQLPNKVLEKGNVITVEPGLYFEELNIGVRIEDNILITENGCELLSKEIIKDPKDIEEFINK